MEKKVRGIKKFFAEFKTFITRGNVLDMAVGVIVGGAFTGIVNGLSNYILKPIINWLLALILSKDGLAGAVTFLSKAYTTETATDGTITQTVDLANSIYIDWGAFISAIINFLLVAFTLFVIVRMINRIHKAKDEAEELADLKAKKKKEIKKIRKEQGVSKAEAKKLYAEKLAAAEAKKAEDEKLAAEKAAADAAAAAALAEEKATANTKLLEEIRDLLKNR